ncbi:MAG: PQQ-dependent sugar dehydrogenase [Ignavibacteriales bacterium]|nr:PQQ-dependent sugar dehydrogenase [Ignavibacteriales bacterium]
MKKFILKVIVSIPILIGCKSTQAQLVSIQPAFPNLSFEQPTDIQHPPDGTNRLFVLSQPGTIYVFNNDPNTSSKKIFLDIKNKVLFGGEQGLLGLAFHSDYKNNGYFYVNYTTDNPRRTIVSRFKVSSNDPDKTDSSSELIILEVDQPYTNHNGGQILFGPDGYLYISFGDGGSGGDPQNNAQNLKSLLGKILRIDVNNTSAGKNYAIPNDNPFKGNTNELKEEIFAWGLRNVWRFSFDLPTNRIWAADVGQNEWEEIDIIEKGKNYGWRIMEGNHCYNPPAGCNTTNLTLPIWEYGHNSEGGFSITGGFVYRGKSAKEIYGKYVYGDFGSGNIWALEYDGSKVQNSLVISSSHQISTFGIDQNNELYFADYSTGKLYKFRGTPTRVGSLTLPKIFDLKQNYPNPFNPSTTIEYVIPNVEMGYIPSLQHITLKVYDILGREIATLVNKYQPPGEYSVKFDVGANRRFTLQSGIYFYQLIIGVFSLSKKMILTK